MPDAPSLSPLAGTADPPSHGGDLARVMAAPGAFQGAWLDLSTGISPWPYPVEGIPASAWTRLPGSTLEARLLAAATAYYGAPGPACVAAAPGSQALIQWLPRLRAASRVAVLGPTYGEHATVWVAAGHDVATLRTEDELDDGDWDVVVMTNPNNPDGRRMAPGRLVAFAARLARRGGLLVVDEAFADIAPELSLASAVERSGLVVLRSFGKFFGLGGLRLGFALTEPGLAANLRAALGPWAVSGPAAWIAGAALADRSWIAATRERLAVAAARLDACLGAAGLRILGGTTLFRLVDAPRASTLYQQLLRQGIYARAFPDRPSWLRFGLPPDEEGLARLARALNVGATSP